MINLDASSQDEPSKCCTCREQNFNTCEQAKSYPVYYPNVCSTECMLDTLKVTLHEPLPKETSPQKQRKSTNKPLKIGKFVLHIRTVHSREAIFFYHHLVDSVFLFCFVYLHVKNHHVAIEIVICPPIRVTSTSSRERVLALG